MRGSLCDFWGLWGWHKPLVHPRCPSLAGACRKLRSPWPLGWGRQRRRSKCSTQVVGLGQGVLTMEGQAPTPQLTLLFILPALKATQTELLELRCKYDEEAASK